jgi:hypothetical protein
MNRHRRRQAAIRRQGQDDFYHRYVRHLPELSTEEYLSRMGSPGTVTQRRALPR